MVQCSFFSSLMTYSVDVEEPCYTTFHLHDGHCNTYAGAMQRRDFDRWDFVRTTRYLLGANKACVTHSAEIFCECESASCRIIAATISALLN